MLFDPFAHVLFLFLQPESPPASPLPRSEEDDGDLNKALGVQRFQQILHPAATVPDDQHHSYHEEDIECERPVCVPVIQTQEHLERLDCLCFLFFMYSADHRHSSHHIHRPLSKLPADGRRKKNTKKRRKDKDHRSSHPPSSGPIEEGEDEEEEEDEGTEGTPAPPESERVKDVEVLKLFNSVARLT